MNKRANNASEIIAYGQDRALGSVESREAWAKIETRIRRKYAGRMEGVGLLRRMKLTLQRSREIARKRRAYVAKTAPDWGLYFASHP